MELSVEFCWRRFREGLIMTIIQRVSRKTLLKYFHYVLGVCVDHVSYLYISLCNDPISSCSSKVTHRTNTSLSLRERPPFPVFHFHFLAKTVALLPRRARTLVATRARCSAKGTSGVWQAIYSLKGSPKNENSIIYRHSKPLDFCSSLNE